jgi:hypothetical protein
MNCKNFRTRSIYSFLKMFGDTGWCDYARCAASSKPKDDLVCGMPPTARYEDLRFCDSMRKYGECGVEAELYEAKS